MSDRSRMSLRHVVLSALVVCCVVAVGTGCELTSFESSTVERPDLSAPVLDLAPPTPEVAASADEVPVELAAPEIETGEPFDLAPAGDSSLEVPRVAAMSPVAPAPPAAPSAAPPAAPSVSAPERLTTSSPFDPRVRRGAELLVDPGDQRLAAVAAGAVARVEGPWRQRLDGWQIRFLGGRAGHRGMTLTGPRVIEVYVRSSDDESSVAHVLAHEIGHALDVSRLNDALRTAWLGARGLPGSRTWWADDRASDFATGAGDLAESFAWIAAGQQQWNGRLGPPPDAAQALLLKVMLGLT